MWFWKLEKRLPLSLFDFCWSVFSLIFSVLWSFLRPMFSFYCSVSLYSWLTNRNVRMDSNRSVYCESFGVFFVCKLVNLGLSLSHFYKTLPKTAYFESCFDSDFICGALSAFFPERNGWFPKEDWIQGEGKAKKNSLIQFDISVN